MTQLQLNYLARTHGLIFRASLSTIWEASSSLPPGEPFLSNETTCDCLHRYDAPR